MADFAVDTAVHCVAAGHDRAELSPAWEVWGPIGGYVAAISLRALAAASELPRPASFHCDFLSAVRFGTVDLEVATLRRGKRSHALQVAMNQGDTPVLSATAWFVDAGMSGLDGRPVQGEEQHPPHWHTWMRLLDSQRPLDAVTEAASFHDFAPAEEWLLCDAHAPVAREGVIGCRGHLWTPAGHLVASGNATLFCRPNPMAKAAAATSG